MKVTIESKSIRKVALLKGLSDAEIEQVLEDAHEVSYPAGTVLFTFDQPGEVVYIIVEGAVKVYLEGAHSKSTTLAVLSVGEIVGEMSMADSLAHSAAASTLDDTTLIWMSHAHLRDCLDKIPSLNRSLANVLSRRLRLADAHIQSLSALDLFGRVARQLLTFAQEYGQPAPGGGLTIPFRLTQSDLADLVGASRGRVNSVLMSFREDGYLRVDSGFRITLDNQEALARRCV